MMRANEFIAEDYDWEWSQLGNLHPFQQSYKPKINWPPSEEEIREIERRALQDPEWLAYYKRFGWDSWTQVPQSSIWFDPHRKTVSVYDIPSITKEWDPKKEEGIIPDRTLMKLDLNGNVVQGPKNSIPLPRALDLVKHYIKTVLSGENLRYMTGRYYIRFGRWKDDERSQNWLATREQGKPVFEKGVSAYHADWVPQEQRWAIDESMNYDTITGTLQSLLYNPNKKIFLVQGDELDEEGADGEPLLHNVKLIKTLKVTDVYMPGVFDPREEGLEEDTEPTRIKLRGFGPSEKSKEWVAKINSMFYKEGNNNYIFWNHEGNIIPRGKEEMKDIAAYVQFELVPKQQNKVEVKWIQATPLRGGYGAKGMKILQDLAQEAGIKLTLYAWDKGQVSQKNLIKFYKKQGFNQLGSSGNMEWEPK